ncbi:ribbon-helix-helix protein, CopG family [Ramlibacter sp. WS9]|uniref:ribbon-helix-helix domain-containing protein n=1 Tax=Ramlibacter sp. WS9 TaxID=1882741 RepID=UPI001141E755|nr:ribbon-helix-helix protein, CopG family [Ramlibacter sp. WS9]ROZ72081.1 ribbon-helix-helix protein, CopG family [Ramlibacter sp. WS9]
MAQKKSKSSTTTTRRTSVTFPSDLYRTLEQIAEQQKLSVAWVIRDATEKYVSERWPLLERKE